MSETIPPTPELLLNRARQAYADGEYSLARQLNLEALGRAKSPGERATALRFTGLCCYRLEELDQSEARLREALRIADEADELHLSLLIRNHLGATLRRLGRLDEALELFRGAIRDASGPELLEPRARLLGNLGALYDELGQRHRADDCYARYEELMLCIAGLDERPSQKRRLANAHGLAGRAARLRGDLEETTWRVEREEALATLPGVGDYRVRALKHRASLLEAQGRYDDAAARYEEARKLASSQASVLISLHRGHAGIMSLKRDLPRAHGLLREAWKMAHELRRQEEIANVGRDLAQVLAGAGLHGEALWYLHQAVETRHRAYEALAGNEVRRLAKPRLDELKDLAQELVNESNRVERTEEERQWIKGLVERVGVAEALTTPATWNLESWAEGIRREARQRLESQLLPGAFDRLHHHSQEDLIRSEVVYHGAVDDLGRSAHLLVVVVERELRERIAGGASKLAEASRLTNDKWAKEAAGWATRAPELGKMLRVLKEAFSSAPGPFLRLLAAKLAPHRNELAALGALNKQVEAVDGQRGISLLGIRNAVTHGENGRLVLDRRVVDAMRRLLFIEPPLLLSGLVGVKISW